MKKLFIICLSLLLASVNVHSQTTLVTVAEKSDYKSTSRYKDVMEFISELTKSSPYIRVENIATSVEGRDIPLLIIGNPLARIA